MGHGNSSTPSPGAIRDTKDAPTDAGTLILIDRSTGEPRILMGRRRADLAFLPNKFVFPGGRISRFDRSAPSADELPHAETARLMSRMRGEPSVQRARSLAMAAIRETFEETGLLVGLRRPAAKLPDAGPWRAFLDHGVMPCLGVLTFFARAITPPGRPRRYDTRFFAAEASAIAHRTGVTDGELSALDWFTFDDARALDLPGITRVVIEDLADRLKSGLPGPPGTPVPFYFHRRGTFERAMLSGLTETPPAGLDDLEMDN